MRVHVNNFVVSVLGIMAITNSTVLAVPAPDAPLFLQQPDGTPITLYVRGDEFYHWMEDGAGYTVVHDRGTYVYAALDRMQELMPTVWRVGRHDPSTLNLTPRTLPPAEVRMARRQAWQSEAESPAALQAVIGTIPNLVILCRFSNHSIGTHTRPQADYDTLFNATGPPASLAPHGSVRELYWENSYGILTFNSTVLAWVTLPQTESYYANGQSGSGSLPNSKTMVNHAVALVDAFVDFSDFDVDSDGDADYVTVIHSGYGAEWFPAPASNNMMHSHKWQTNANTNDGVVVANYINVPALHGSSGNAITVIGLIAHEMGHVFGLPDLYDNDHSSMGVGRYCLMGHGTWLSPPCHYSAWCKYVLGWTSPTTLSVPGLYTANAASSTPNVFRVSSGFPANEYLLIENRQKLRLDAGLPGSGLAIWHIDENVCCNTLELCWSDCLSQPLCNLANHYRVALLQADGMTDLECNVESPGANYGDAGDLYHAQGVSAIHAESLPSTIAYQGGNAYLTYNAIWGITSSQSTMRFKFGPGSPSEAPPPHDVPKNRYLSFAPNNGPVPVALRVNKTTPPTGSCWVAAPDAAGNARCVSTPVYREWTEPVLHVADCEIVPAANYEIQATTNGTLFSWPLTLGTIARPTPKYWGDLVGVNNGSAWTPPNQLTNVTDILAVLSFIAGSAIKPTFQMANLQAVSSADPCLNAFVNAADVLIVVKAAAGNVYPFTNNPAACPTCP